MAERAREVLAVAHGAELGVTYAARREKDVLRPEGEVFRRYDKAVLLRLDAGHGAVRDDGRFAVSQEIAESVYDRRRLSVGGEHSRVGHPSYGNV